MLFLLYAEVLLKKKKIFTEDELMEMSAVAQSSPGAIAVNLAALSGV